MSYFIVNFGRLAADRLGLPYPSDLTDEQWAVLGPLLCRASKRGPKHRELRVVAVDVTGLPIGAGVVAASTTENRATELLLEHLVEIGVAARLELVGHTQSDNTTPMTAASAMR